LHQVHGERGSQDGQLLVSGSYLLGINAADSDVDAIFLGPRFVTRDDFFDVLAPALKAAPGATTVLPIATASTPIIELELRGVAIDLQFVTLQYNAVPRQLNLLDDAALQGLDDAAVRGLFDAPGAPDEDADRLRALGSHE
jgi:poly(A) polymerase